MGAVGGGGDKDAVDELLEVAEERNAVGAKPPPEASRAPSAPAPPDTPPVRPLDADLMAAARRERARVRAERQDGWFETASTLSEDSAPSDT